LVTEVVPIPAAALDRVHEVDVSEVVDAIYVQQGTTLVRLERTQRRLPRSRKDWAAEVARWKGYVNDGGTAFGAFESDRMVGFSVTRAHLSERTAQLAGLYVDKALRRTGLGTALVAAVADWARASGALNLYVSAAPSESAVEFYRSFGFLPLLTPNPELFELEPEDIHMSLELRSSRA
jgi:GNAT superfamily N-acetyltransferase